MAEQRRRGPARDVLIKFSSIRRTLVNHALSTRQMSNEGDTVCGGRGLGPYSFLTAPRLTVIYNYETLTNRFILYDLTFNIHLQFKRNITHLT